LSASIHFSNILRSLMELVNEINRLLEEKEERLRIERSRKGLLAYLARAKRYGDRCLLAFLLRRCVFMPGSPLGVSTEGISHSNCSNRSCASVALIASDVRPQFMQKCSLVAGFHLMTRCFIVSVKKGDGSVYERNKRGDPSPIKC